ncbi:MAG: NUMOD4 domain-containing protein [Peptostreptococcaceae bacterium]
MMLLKEEWKNLGFMGYSNYEVSNLGNVKSLNYGLMAKKLHKTGYERVRLYNNGNKKEFLVHRLVAFAFVENPNPKKYNVVNHIDEDKLNNCVDNLEWCDTAYNVTYGTAIERRVASIKESGKGNYDQLKEINRKPVYKYNKSGLLIKRFKSLTDCMNDDGVYSNVMLSETPIKNDFVYSYNELTNEDVLHIFDIYLKALEDKKVMVYKYSLDKELIESIEDIHSTYSGQSKYSILDCCNNYKESYQGYIWSFIELSEKELEERICRIKNYKPIYQYGINGDLINMFDNIDQIDGYNKTTIHKYCNREYMSIHDEKYIWSYNKLDKVYICSEVERLHRGSKRYLYMYDLSSNLVKKYDAISDCISDGYVKSKIHDCLNGVSLIHNDMIFSYVELNDIELSNIIKNIKLNNNRYRNVVQKDKFTGDIVRAWSSTREIYRDFCKSGAITECCNGKRKWYKGYSWEYEEIE